MCILNQSWFGFVCRGVILFILGVDVDMYILNTWTRPVSIHRLYIFWVGGVYVNWVGFVFWINVCM